PPLADQLWLEEVSLWLTPEERAAFAELETEAERDLWRRDFWRRRDPAPAVPFHPLKEEFSRHLRALRDYGFRPGEERGQLLLLHGRPTRAYGSECATAADATPTDDRVQPVTCMPSRPHQLYDFRPAGALDEAIVFVEEDGHCRLFDPERHRFSYQRSFGVALCRGSGDLPWRLDGALRNPASWDEIRSRGLSLAALRDAVAPLAAAHSGEPRLEVAEFAWVPEESVAVVRAHLVVPVDLAWRSRPLPWRVLQLQADAYREGELVARADTTTTISGDPGSELRLRWELRLPPGSYGLVLRLEDEEPHLFTTATFPLDVPSESRIFPNVETIRTATEPTLRLAPLPGLQSGVVTAELLRFPADLGEVQYLLDELEVAVSDQPPFTVEVDLGVLPLEKRLEAVARDRSGAAIARDSITVNQSLHRFTVELDELGDVAAGELRLTARAHVPLGRRIDSLSLFVEDEEVVREQDVHLTYRRRLAPGSLARGQGLLVRLVARLDDGTTKEETRLLSANASERVDVELVEVFAGVRDRKGRPLLDLQATDFTVQEDGRVQTVRSFRRVEELPLYVALLLDTSGSMVEEMSALREAATNFLDHALRPDDRATLLPFTYRAFVAVPFTNDLERLRAAAAALLARGGTSVLNSAVQSLHYLRQAPGKRALIVVSDGFDRDSTLTYDDVLDYATRVDVAIYTIGLGGRKRRPLLRGLAERTGGLYFPIAEPNELTDVFAAIETELRSQYLLTYEPTPSASDGFRRIRIDVDQRGARVQARPGYYP
ncbi:MAG: VWA domain-containing protein, partial [Acidobacteriota bacterium]